MFYKIKEWFNPEIIQPRATWLEFEAAYKKEDLSFFEEQVSAYYKFALTKFEPESFIDVSLTACLIDAWVIQWKTNGFNTSTPILKIVSEACPSTLKAVQHYTNMTYSIIDGRHVDKDVFLIDYKYLPWVGDQDFNRPSESSSHLNLNDKIQLLDKILSHLDIINKLNNRHVLLRHKLNKTKFLDSTVDVCIRKANLVIQNFFYIKELFKDPVQYKLLPIIVSRLDFDTYIKVRPLLLEGLTKNKIPALFNSSNVSNTDINNFVHRLDIIQMNNLLIYPETSLVAFKKLISLFIENMPKLEETKLDKLEPVIYRIFDCEQKYTLNELFFMASLNDLWTLKPLFTNTAEKLNEEAYTLFNQMFTQNKDILSLYKELELPIYDAWLVSQWNRECG